jgi:iron-sulfur cluster repair protein YtfE (RIC family)
MNLAKRIERLEDQLRTGEALNREIEALWAELASHMTEQDQVRWQQTGRGDGSKEDRSEVDPWGFLAAGREATAAV